MVAISARVATVAMVAVAVLAGAPALADSHPESVRVPVAVAAGHADPTVVTVVQGDHLWKISKRHLEEHLAHEPGNGEIAPYWRTVIDENRERLRSGDPDLIYPGELIRLPGLGINAQP